jgi:anti-sigma factor RsiW
MGCAFNKSKVSAYIDGEMTGLEMQRVRAHLQVCRECAQAAEEMRSLKQALVSLRTMAPPEGLADRICAQLADVRPLSPLTRLVEKLRDVFTARRRVRTAWAVGCAAAVMLFAVLIVGVHQEPSVISAAPLDEYVQHQIAEFDSKPFIDYSEWAYRAGNDTIRLVNYQTASGR